MKTLAEAPEFKEVSKNAFFHLLRRRLRPLLFLSCFASFFSFGIEHAAAAEELSGERNEPLRECGTVSLFPRPAAKPLSPCIKWEEGKEEKEKQKIRKRGGKFFEK